MAAFARRTLGRTGLLVSPVGVGGGSRISSADTLYAFDRGINYFFFSSDLHHAFYQSSAAAVTTLCRSGSRLRDQVVLATVSYTSDPDKLIAVLVDQLGELRIDYIDVFHWGWITDHTDCARLFAASDPLKHSGELATMVRRLAQMNDRAAEINDRLIAKGLVRFVGASFHSREMAARYVAGPLDVLMLRYNIAHTGVERDVFPLLSGDKAVDPGIVAFNTSHEGFSFFASRPHWYPAHFPPLSHGDHYRFALSHPAVDMVLIGPANRQHLDHALAAIDQGPLPDDHMTFLRRYGDLHRKAARAVASPPPPLAGPTAV